MGNIVLLDDLTINKIAAGEVIERPANVVKELVENSIDAGATNIIIEIRNGGKSLIKIVDNGKGISADDIPLSLERHATSKIRKVEDLENTYSMGFRGEALASISSISTLTMMTKTKDENGTKVIAEAGEIVSVEEVGVPVGTTIMVENLFFNTPVRYKFLKNDATEFKYIKDWVQKAALSEINVAFKLINDGKTVFQTNGSGNIRDIIYLLYGKEIEKNLLDVNYESDNIKVTGVIGNTTIARDNRKCQILFLNNRNIKNQMLTNSADQAFKGATGIGKYGFFILNLEMPASYYDVNVHPTKMEVRFKDEDKLYKIFYHAIKSAMLKSEFLDNSGETQKEEKEEQKREKYIENELEFLTNRTETKAQVELINRENEREIEYQYVGILFRTYIIIQIDDDMFLIDQHAAMERFMYEKISKELSTPSNNTYELLVPIKLEYNISTIPLILEKKDEITRLGIELEEFGPTTVIVRVLPVWIPKDYCVEFIRDIINHIITNRNVNKGVMFDNLAKTLSCKKSIKGNMSITELEVQALMKKLDECNFPYTCPHGRPTIIKFTEYEIEKMFKRVM